MNKLLPHQTHTVSSLQIWIFSKLWKNWNANADHICGATAHSEATRNSQWEDALSWNVALQDNIYCLELFRVKQIHFKQVGFLVGCKITHWYVWPWQISIHSESRFLLVPKGDCATFLPQTDPNKGMVFLSLGNQESCGNFKTNRFIVTCTRAVIANFPGLVWSLQEPAWISR